MFLSRYLKIKKKLEISTNLELNKYILHNVNDVKLHGKCSLRPIRYFYFCDNSLSATFFFLRFPLNLTSFTRRVMVMIRHVRSPSGTTKNDWPY